MAEKIDGDFSDDELTQVMLSLLRLSHEERIMLLSYAKSFKALEFIEKPDSNNGAPQKESKKKSSCKKSAYKSSPQYHEDNIFPEEKSFVQNRDKKIFEVKLADIKRSLKEISGAVTELEVFLNCGAFLNPRDTETERGVYKTKNTAPKSNENTD